MKFEEYQEKAHSTAVYPDLGSMVIGNMYDAGIIKDLEYHGVNSQDETQKNAVANPYYPALGLAGEVGEYCNKLKKVMRDKSGIISQEFKDMAKGELGDVLWYLSECASSLDLSLEEIAQDNITKLASRAERGKLQGSGDNR